MTRDYRRHLRVIGRKSIGGLRLRTEKHPGDLEIIHVGKGEYQLHRHEEQIA
jgi:hypothetical protein